MPPKKAAKKSPPKHDLHKAAKDARRAFEHLGRVQAIAALSAADDSSLPTLVTIADAAFQSKQYEDSANLLRAAEHLSFAAIVTTNSVRLSPLLTQALQQEFDHLLEKAEKHGSEKALPEAIRSIYARMKADAASAIKHREYRTALELVRGAEALTHVALNYNLNEPAPRKKLKG